MSVSRVFQGCFKGASRMFHACLRGSLRVLNRFFKVFQKSFNGNFQKYVVTKFQGCVDRNSGVLLRVFEGSERGVSMEFLEGFKEVPGHFIIF